MTLDGSRSLRLSRWVARVHLDAAGLTTADAAERAWANLDQVALGAEGVTVETAGASKAMLATDLPSKASLLLAPALRERIEDVIGRPVLAVAPDRDFVYLWKASRRDLMTGMGGVVCRVYARAPYPLSTEIFHTGDSLRAVGAYAVASNPSSD